MFEITWQFVAVVVAIISLFSGVVLLAVGVMLRGHRTHVDSSIDNLSKVIIKGNDEVKRIENELIDLKIALPNHYVKREDWIRFASVIDAKQDALADKLSVTNAIGDKLSINSEILERVLKRMNKDE